MGRNLDGLLERESIPLRILAYKSVIQMFDIPNRTLWNAFLYLDIVILLLFVAFRESSVMTVISLYDIMAPDGIERFRYLAWGGTLFVTCSLCSYWRRYRLIIPMQYTKGVIYFELMVLGAFVLILVQSLSQADTIDPFWLLELNWFSYLFEVVTTAGAGYVLADFLSRVNFLLRSSKG